ncbi:MAG TPA: hypothetical protein VM327_09900 [Candidatus Thermoplasmatota archaeon]|nr:hypothetical protein [Candidatus Thermoplasmatota archaeon]
MFSIDDPATGRPVLGERDHAIDWSSRAKQSYRLAIEDPVYEARYHNFCEGENCWQSALEHAGRAEDSGLLLRINDEIERLRDRALLAIQAEG